MCEPSPSEIFVTSFGFSACSWGSLSPGRWVALTNVAFRAGTPAARREQLLRFKTVQVVVHLRGPGQMLLLRSRSNRAAGILRPSSPGSMD